YVMVHRLIPVAADRTKIECTWAFAPESLAKPGFDPGYAVDFWDVVNRQDWQACEAVQRGLGSPHAVPGPLAREEDAVYEFVTMVARGYQGERIWTTGPPGAHELRPQANTPGPRLIIWPAMIARCTSLVPSQIRSTRSSR